MNTEVTTREAWAATSTEKTIPSPSPDFFTFAASTQNVLGDQPVTTIQPQSTRRSLRRVMTTAALATKRTAVVVDSAVLQIWEGTVKSVDSKRGEMDVLLVAKMGNEKPHTAQIDLQWVPEQDLDLLRPGAVFYLTLYKRTQKGTIQNAQELRFRRRPAWSRQQVHSIREEADRIGAKLVERPAAE